MNVDKIQPSTGRYLVKVHRLPETTEGGIVRPEAAQSKLSKGTILARNKDDESAGTCRYWVGATVHFAPFGAFPIGEESDDLCILPEQDILALEIP